MLRLTQTVRNVFLRIEGFLSVIFKSFWGFVTSFFGFFAKIFGFTKSNYFLESDETQGIKQEASPKEPMQTDQNKTSETTATNRRRSNVKMDDYYLNMARDVKKK